MDCKIRQRAFDKNTEGKPNMERNEIDDINTIIAKKDNKLQKTLKKIGIRLIFGSLCFWSFIFLVYCGHLYIMTAMMITQCIIFKELCNVRYSEKDAKDVPLFRTITWFWFAAAMFFSYGDAVCLFFKPLEGVVHYHQWISLGLYSFCFILTVLAFKQPHMEYQMGQLAWTCTSIGMVVFQTIRVSNNILAGMFWYVFPCMLIFVNDSCAYFAGVPFGHKILKRPFLPKLSPNKSWEGFLGGAVCTLIISWFVPYVPFLLSEWMICPLIDPTAHELHCDLNPVFIYTEFAIPKSLQFIGMSSISLYPIQFHALCFAAYASLIAPFGGFFASAIKRAYNIKDFDSLIPGHGGILDRMDCQLLMALCVSAHYNTFIRYESITFPVLMDTIHYLPQNQKREIFDQLSKDLGLG